MEKYATNYSFVFEFESNFEREYKMRWVKENYRLPFYAISIYLAVVFGLKSYMKSRSAFRLRTLLVIWNASLAIFSFLGTLRSIPVLFFDLSVFGFHHTVCDSSNFINTSVFWGWLFALSKFPELGDTLFIVLRKQKLMFLHWYHHVTVLLSSWFTFGDLSAPARWMVTMNYTVHAIMYSYYTVRALTIKPPLFVAMSITSLQILQMLVGFYICIYVYFSRINGVTCDISENVANLLLFIYSTYFLLFVNYFYNTYVRSAPKLQKVE